MNTGKKISEIYHIRRNAIVLLAAFGCGIWTLALLANIWIPDGGLDVVAYATGGFFWTTYLLESLPGLKKPARLVLYDNGLEIDGLWFWKWEQIESYGSSPAGFARSMGLGSLSAYNLTLDIPPDGIPLEKAKDAGAKVKKIEEEKNLITLGFYFPFGMTNIKRFSFTKQMIRSDKGSRKNSRELAELNADLKKFHANRKT